MYHERFYRKWMESDLQHCFAVKVGESDLLVSCDQPLQELAHERTVALRGDLEAYIARDPLFQSSLVPHPVPADAPEIVRRMAAAAQRWQVGPMAGVAGAVAQELAVTLLQQAQSVIVENGGDIYARMTRPLIVRLYAGEHSPFSDKIVFAVDASQGVAVCTSSRTVGPSLSFGMADAMAAIAPGGADADCAATFLGNQIRRPEDIDDVIKIYGRAGLLSGIVACAADRLGFWGDIEIKRAKEASKR